MVDQSPTPDWRKLEPHRPLAPGSDAYIERPTTGGSQIAEWILGGGNTVLVGGPVGIGKSTECANAALRMQKSRIACLVQLDRLTNIRRLDADEVLQLIGGRLFEFAVTQLGFPANHALAPSIPTFETPSGRQAWRAVSPRVASLLIEEVARSHQGRVALVIDGLEKLSEGSAAAEIFDALGTLPPTVDLVVVVPWHAVYGRTGDVVIRPGERLVVMRPLETSGEAGAAAARFFGAVLAHRVLNPPAELPETFHVLLGKAFKHSGGVPRTLLQLIADAATYARVKRDDAWPNDDDLEDALKEQRASFRRLLAPGDTEAIRTAVGTDGRELDLPRKVRLLAHGILLERSSEQLFAHPLAPVAA